MMTKSLIYPRRQPLVKNPVDYGMDYQDVEFQSPDSVLIKAWLIPGGADRIAIVTHPMPFTRYGFSVKHQGFFKVTKKEVELLKTARVLHDAGYDVLTFDFRNHGESGEGNEGVCGVGLNEWPDVIGALDYIAAHPQLNQKKIAFVSHCMGANATIMAMSRKRDKFHQVKCLVAIQPVSMDVLVPCLMEDKYGMFSSRVPAIDRRIEKVSGYSLKEMSPRDAVRDIMVPVLFVQVKADPWTVPDDVQGFFADSPDPKTLLWIEGEERFDGYDYFGDHPEELIGFLNQHMDSL
jgi:pimeloyl-ACP methyl ester carboxylesterase